MWKYGSRIRGRQTILINVFQTPLFEFERQSAWNGSVTLLERSLFPDSQCSQLRGDLAGPIAIGGW
jgi:hypothetical protein